MGMTIAWVGELSLDGNDKLFAYATQPIFSSIWSQRCAITARDIRGAGKAYCLSGK